MTRAAFKTGNQLKLLLCASLAWCLAQRKLSSLSIFNCLLALTVAEMRMKI